VCLPLLIFPCTIKSRSFFLALAYLGDPGKGPSNVVVVVVVVVCRSIFSPHHLLRTGGFCWNKVNSLHGLVDGNWD